MHAVWDVADVTLETPLKPGYTFNGWYTKPSDGGFANIGTKITNRIETGVVSTGEMTVKIDTTKPIVISLI